MRGRDLHAFILSRVRERLGDRSWSWLADEAGIPRTTLITQASRPRFSVDVLVNVAHALDRDVAYFLPGRGRTEPRDEARRAFELLEKHLFRRSDAD